MAIENKRFQVSGVRCQEKEGFRRQASSRFQVSVKMKRKLE